MKRVKEYSGYTETQTKALVSNPAKQLAGVFYMSVYQLEVLKSKIRLENLGFVVKTSKAESNTNRANYADEIIRELK